MHDHYDRLENRPAAARETQLFRDLRHILTVSKPRAPALRTQLKGIDIAGLSDRCDLHRIPIWRDDDAAALQAASAPLGGLAATRIGALAQIFVDKRGLISPRGRAKDWWGMARALYAAGLRKKSLVLNSLSYDLVADGHMIETGARAIGCPVIPAGNADVDRTLDVVRRLSPDFFCGRSATLGALLDRAQDRAIDVSCLKSAFLVGPISLGLRSRLGLCRIDSRQVWILPGFGLVAYESVIGEGLVLNEGMLLEVVDPVSGKAVEAGFEGEIVLSRINADYPLLRYGTGMTSSILPSTASCGRTNLRIEVPRATVADDDAHPIAAAEIAEIAQRYPALRKLHIFRKPQGGDRHAMVEGVHREQLQHIKETLHRIADVRGTVELAEPGTLTDDQTIVIDEHLAH